MSTDKKTKWLVTMGLGVRELKCYPEEKTEQQASERALFLYPNWSVISVAKHVPASPKWVL